MTPEERREYNRVYYQLNREKVLAKSAARKEERNRVQAEYRSKNVTKVKEKNRKYYANNKSKILQRHIEAPKEGKKRAQRKYQKAARAKRAANEGFRRSRKLRATPRWANREVIADIYTKAALTGDHVDHIVPLRSRTVCGLHCEFNLQTLAPTDNIRKSNRYWPDMP